LGARPVLRTLDRLPADRRAPRTYAIGSGSDMVTFVLSDDLRNRVTVRPSGTEPKLKYYIQVHEPPSGHVGEQKHRLSELALAIAREVVDHSGSVIGKQLPPDRASELKAEWAGGVRRLV